MPTFGRARIRKFWHDVASCKSWLLVIMRRFCRFADISVENCWVIHTELYLFRQPCPPLKVSSHYAMTRPLPTCYSSLRTGMPSLCIPKSRLTSFEQPPIPCTGSYRTLQPRRVPVTRHMSSPRRLRRERGAAQIIPTPLRALAQSASISMFPTPSNATALATTLTGLRGQASRTTTQHRWYVHLTCVGVGIL